MRNKIFIAFLTVIAVAGFSFALETKVLKNGQTVVVQQVKNNPIVIIDTWVKTGSINENDKNTGVSHFLEHLLFKGSKNYKTGEFDRIIESKGGLVNAATSKDFTHFYIQLPSKYFDLALDLHSDMLLRPLIPEEELEKERKVVIEEISKDLNNPDKQVYENFINAFYVTHPYKRKVIGTKEVISDIPRKDILDYYKKYYIPQNMITVVVGDVEPEDVFNKIQSKFNISPKVLRKIFNKKEPLISKQIIKKDYQPVSSGYLILGYRVPDITGKDNYALDVLSTVLGDGKSSILYKKIKEEQQLAFDIDVSNATYKEDGMFMIDANYEPENLDKLLVSVYDEIDKIINNGITENQLALAKKIIETETKYSRESISNIASQIGYTTTLSNSTKYYNNYLDNINCVKISDIQHVANKYLKKKNSVLSIVLPEAEKDKKVNHNVKDELTYKATLVKDASGIKKYVLNNKVTVLINKNDSNDIVSISIYAKGGKFIETIPTTSNLVASTMLSGTKNYSKFELANIMEENGIKISPQTSADAFAVNVVTTKEQLKRTLELLNEVINNATFRNEEIIKDKKNKLNAIKQSEDIPLNKVLDSFREMIYGNSEYSIANNQFINYYPKIQQKDLLEYYNKIFSAQNIIISINGNVDIDDVGFAFSKMFKEKGKNFVYPQNKIPYINIPRISVKKMKNLGTAWIFIGWQTCGVLNEKDYAALTVIDSLLGSGMSSRLFVDLREKEGLAYQIASSYSPKLLKGAFTMYIGTNPETVEKSKEMMLNEIKRLKFEKVSDTELQEAKDKVIGRYILSQETNLDKASQIGWFEVTSRGFDYGDKYEKLINNVTSEDIKRVANKYFNDNNVISIIEREK